MPRPLLAALYLLTLSACGGGGGATPGDGSAPGAAASAGGESTATGDGAPADGGDPDKQEFKLNDSDASKRASGVDGSKIEATRTEAAVRFVVVDRDKGPIPGVVISLTAPDGRKFYTGETDAEGFAEVLVPIGQKYDLVYLSLGRDDVQAQVPIADAPKQNINLTLRYKSYIPPPKKRADGKPAEAAPRFELKGVHFDTGKAKLREDSFPRLDKVVEYMTHKPSVRIEVSGHTDNVGNPKKNKKLSQRRADACKDYLVSKGIAADRIESVGYGDEMPVGSNDTEEGRQHNRRIEATEL